MKRKTTKAMWASFYNLGSDTGGVTFKVTKVQLCGEILRLELPPRRVPKYGERWFFVRYNKAGDIVFMGRTFSDFSCEAVPWKLFKKLTTDKAYAELAWVDGRLGTAGERNGTS